MPASDAIRQRREIGTSGEFTGADERSPKRPVLQTVRRGDRTAALSSSALADPTPRPGRGEKTGAEECQRCRLRHVLFARVSKLRIKSL